MPDAYSLLPLAYLRKSETNTIAGTLSLMKKEYTNGEITVVWQPDLCIHSGVCFRSLPSVFKPRERPWIQMENSDSKSIRDTVNACPSGALSIKSQPAQAIMAIQSFSSADKKISVLDKGPIKVAGPCTITLADGSTMEKPNGISLCRCGGSANKPFCDGSHKSNGFIG
jgi:uncharacterized Fe-S cluster protein YjdI